MHRTTAIAALAASAIGAAGSAEAILLDFEGIPDDSNIADYYDGGFATDFTGAPVAGPGPELGIVANPVGFVGTLAPDGGLSSRLDLPSGIGAIDAFQFGLDLTDGASGPLRFFYFSNGDLTVSVFSALGGTGSLLASTMLGPTTFPATGPWPAVQVTLPFEGTAGSVIFTPTGDTLIDDVSLGEGAEVPLPLPGLLLIGGLAALAALSSTARA